MKKEKPINTKKNEETWIKKMPPVYNKTRMLLLQFMASTKKCPREIKYSIVAETVSNLLRMMKQISMADEAFERPKERISFIDKAQDYLNDVKITARVLFDAGGIKKTGFHAITKLEAETLVQLKSWKASELKKII